MSYIRTSCKLPSGKESRSYVIFDGKVLINYAGLHEIDGEELKRLLKEKSDDEIKKILKERLQMSDEETGIVAKRLLRERDKGEWRRSS